jgi:hypothetical protein
VRASRGIGQALGEPDEFTQCLRLEQKRQPATCLASRRSIHGRHNYLALFDGPLEQSTHAAEEFIETPRFKARSGREEALHTLARDLIDAGNALLGEKSIRTASTNVPRC